MIVTFQPNINIVTLLCATWYMGLATPVGTCCNMLGIVSSSINVVKFFMQHFGMLHHVVVVWRSTMLRQGMLR